MNYSNPVATLTNRKMELSIKELPARLGRNNNVVEIYLFHESVSREHCLFECINRRFTVRDLGSTVGTFINGVRLEPNVPYNIEDGAKIQFGKVKMVFHPDYQALAEWERRQSQPAPAPIPNLWSENGKGSTAPAGKKNISVSVRELNDFEYDEDEVVYIECGLKPEEKSLSYTSEIRKKEIEEGALKAEEDKAAGSADLEAEIAKEAEPAGWQSTQVLDPGEAAALEAKAEEAESLEAEIAEEAEPAGWQSTHVLDPVVSAALEAQVADKEAEAAAKEAQAGSDDIFADEGTFKIEEHQDKEEEPGKVLHLTWIDDISGETKKLKIDRFPFAIGRKSDVNDYTIARKGISRKHLRFEENDGEVYVFDDASTNGVRLNGQKITPETLVKLNSGDSIRVLDITFAVKID